MASSPCDFWPHRSPSSSSSTIDHVWNDIKLASLSNSHVDVDLDLDLNSNNNSSTSSSVFHIHAHYSLLAVSNTNKTTLLQDQRHKRIIKNRESAVRSRARKQAYRKGLEAEVLRLTVENSRLKTQLKELQSCLSSSFDNPPRMAAPCRTSSSPF